MTEQPTTTATSRQGFGRFLGGCLRLLLFALVVIAVTAVLYYATPYVYRYVVIPVQNNRVAIDQLRQSHAWLRSDLEDRLADQSQRIAQLEADLAAEREARAELETALNQQEETLLMQAATQTDLEARLEPHSQAIAALEQSLGDLDATIAEVEQSIDLPESEIATLQRRTFVLQVQQATLKARLHLSENNAGMAQLALQEAQQPLRRLNALVPSAEREALAAIEEHLDTVTATIEEQPFTAIQELEILWQLLQRFSGRDG